MSSSGQKASFSCGALCLLRQVCMVSLCMLLPQVWAATGSTGNPVEWVQVGETKDTVLLIDANSITGFEAPNLGLAHRADYMFKGKTNSKLNSATRTAFMLQQQCDEGKGQLTLFFTDKEGQPSGKGETHKFSVAGDAWVDAIARTMCRARQIMMENQRVR